MFAKIDINDIKGFRLGNADNQEAGTGCTVIVAEDGATAGVDVRGGGPATRETDLLRSENSIQKIHAVVLSGGSAFGLEAGSGVMRELEDRNIGFRLSGNVIPIVCQASLFDLGVGQSDVRPDRSMGVRAVREAFSMAPIVHGNYGAGTGATVGKFYGMNRAMKSGLGTFACSDGNIQVGAITAVNAFADVYDGNNNLIAGLLSADRTRIEGTIRPLKNSITPGIMDHKAIRTETVFKKKYRPENVSEEAANTAYSDKSIVASDVASTSDSHPGYETEYEPEMEATPEMKSSFYAKDDSETANLYDSEEKQVPNTSADHEGDDMGYDITFNTTISCLITNAKLTKAQCNKLASILHDGFARAIKPVHSTLDGDTIFVMTTGEKEVNFDAFAALATDIMQFSIIDGVISAKPAYGFPAACQFFNK
jgi:L-aminopeptidase/D-esterase-like protein